ncbi:ADP-ribosylglycohydrolase family protein [Pseudomonas serbica]|jgi:ADP-ribosylglycohydrolase|uniref:ADP-ribosylglycohydrolase family protein n=1 Tax=Pseudomonas serbica TaxID=2965074 RepID=UPI00237AD7EB|nr:ADP-ribosylglycohydrolase family protein [Pseudomonas serbica]
MIGAIIGDIAGSYYEFRDEKDRNANFFIPGHSTITDDSVLSLATADAIINHRSYSEFYQLYARTYPNYGYGPSFMDWAHTNSSYSKPNFSCGNGAGMRVSPVGWAFESVQRVMSEAHMSACITHAHSEGTKGAQAVALAIFLFRNGVEAAVVEEVMSDWFDYETRLDLDVLNEEYTFSPTCQGTIPQALSCVFQAKSFEETIRNGLHVGGDTDTLCAIAGSIAEARFGVPDRLRQQAEEMVDRHSAKFLGVLRQFERMYGRKVEPGGMDLPGLKALLSMIKLHLRLR